MSAYTDSVEVGLKGLDAPSPGVCQDCEACRESCPEYQGDIFDEGSFGSSSCGVCNSHLAGDRFVWHWLDSDGVLMHESDMCVDCVQFMANGVLPEGEGD